MDAILVISQTGNEASLGAEEEALLARDFNVAATVIIGDSFSDGKEEQAKLDLVQQIDACCAERHFSAAKVELSDSAWFRVAADALKRHGISQVVCSYATDEYTPLRDRDLNEWLRAWQPIASALMFDRQVLEKMSGATVHAASDTQAALYLVARRLIALAETEPNFSDGDDLKTPALAVACFDDWESGVCQDCLHTGHAMSVWLKGPAVAPGQKIRYVSRMASALTCGFAQGYSLEASYRQAKAYCDGTLGTFGAAGEHDRDWRLGPLPC